MARITFTALVEEIVGKMAGSVFQDSYGGFQVRTRVTPRNPQTTFQQLRRGEFGFLSASWRGLTLTERQSFIDNAPSPGAGLNFFLQANVNLTLINEPIITTYVPSSDPGTMTLEFVTADPSNMFVRATGGTTVVPAGTKLLTQVTYLKGTNKIFTNPSQFSPIISFDEGTDLSIPTDILSEWQSRYGVLTPDKKLCLKTALIDKSNGRRGADVINCTITEEMAKFVKIFTDVTPVVQSGAGTQDAMPFTLPANTLAQDGDCLSLVYQGDSTVGGGGNTANFFINATSLVGYTCTTNQTWALYIFIQRVNSNTVRISGYAFDIFGNAQFNGANQTPLDFTVTNTLKIVLDVPTSGSISAVCASINKELV